MHYNFQKMSVVERWQVILLQRNILEKPNFTLQMLKRNKWIKETSLSDVLSKFFFLCVLQCALVH